MGATQVRVLSVFDRQRLPYGNHSRSETKAFARLDIPAVGFPDTCPICEALQFLNNLRDLLRDDCLLNRIDSICSRWGAVKGSDNYYLNGISISHIDLPEDIKTALDKYQRIYQQGNIEISTDLGLCLFSVESTVISLSLDFLNTCLVSQKLESNIKLLLLSAHILSFDYLQLSEKHFCRLLDTLCDLLEDEKQISEYTALAVIAVCGQTPIFQEYAQNHMMKRTANDPRGKNNDYLLLKLALYQRMRVHNVEVDPEYRRELHCYLKNEKNSLEMIYDLFLYTEREYKQSHRQAFKLIIATDIKTNEATYQRALQYIHKLKGIYEDKSIEEFFHDPEPFNSAREGILQDITSLEKSLGSIKRNDDHLNAKETLDKLLHNIQEVNRGLYLRANEQAGNRNISTWLDYCEEKAKERSGITDDTMLKIINPYTLDNRSHTDVYPWFYAYADVTEEVINLIVDMMLQRTSKLRDFLRPSASRNNNCYDGIVAVYCKREYVELSFYNATNNPKQIEEIRSVKKSKENRPSVIVFRQFEKNMSANAGHEEKIPCFEWYYVEECYPDYLADKSAADDVKHLYRATMRIPYVDMGSAFGN